MTSISVRVRVAAAAVAAVVVLLLIVLLFVGGGDDDGLATPSADGTIRLDVFVSPGVAAFTDRDELEAAIRRTLGAAVNAEVTVRFVDDAPSDLHAQALDALAEETGYAAARALIDELQAREPETQEEQDEIADAALQAIDELVAAEQARAELALANAPLVDVDPGSALVQITGSRQYGAERPEGEDWAFARIGVALELYQDEPELRHQSIANQVVSAVGLLAGLELRPGAPGDAMVESVDFEAEEHLTRDSTPVIFNADELRTVRAAFVASAGS